MIPDTPKNEKDLDRACDGVLYRWHLSSISFIFLPLDTRWNDGRLWRPPWYETIMTENGPQML